MGRFSYYLTMTTQLHDTGEEYIMDVVFGGATDAASFDIGLYNDSTDGLSDSSDVGDITTEPTGTNYARQTATNGSDFTVSDTGDWEAAIATQSYVTDDSNQSIDAYFVTVTFTSDDTGDGGDTTHLLFTGTLDQTYDLGSVDNFDLSDAGIAIN